MCSLTDRRQDEREAAELAEWEADEKRRKDLQDFHQDFAENKVQPSTASMLYYRYMRMCVHVTDM